MLHDEKLTFNCEQWWKVKSTIAIMLILQLFYFYSEYFQFLLPQKVNTTPLFYPRCFVIFKADAAVLDLAQKK